MIQYKKLPSTFLYTFTLVDVSEDLALTLITGPGFCLFQIQTTLLALTHKHKVKNLFSCSSALLTGNIKSKIESVISSVLNFCYSCVCVV